MAEYAAIVLAAGSGKRMNSTVHKQYLALGGKPLIYYSLKAFEESCVSFIILVTGAGEEEYCRREIIEKYGIQKIKQIVAGGKERYHSVYEGLKAAGGADYVLIHDGARPFVDQGMILRSMEAVKEYQACIVGMPVKDTIKIVDRDNFAIDTPDRQQLWQIQTPQTFSYKMIYEAYKQMLMVEDDKITDDAMVLERITGQRVKVIAGSYQNIKITTPEDLIVAEAYQKSINLKNV